MIKFAELGEQYMQAKSLNDWLQAWLRLTNTPFTRDACIKSVPAVTCAV